MRNAHFPPRPWTVRAPDFVVSFYINVDVSGATSPRDRPPYPPPVDEVRKLLEELNLSTCRCDDPRIRCVARSFLERAL